MFMENCSNIFSLKNLQFVICTMQATPKLEIHNSLNCDPKTNNSGSRVVQNSTKKFIGKMFFSRVTML